jgi:hypothetical protein
MFGKKKVAKNPTSYQCQFPGCGLICTDERSLRTHVDWAHTIKSTKTSENTKSP